MLSMVTLAFVNYRDVSKKGKLNIHEYSLCFIVEKTFGPWDLRRIIILFYRHNYLNKVVCVNEPTELKFKTANIM